MATSFKDIEEELRSQYALVYTPADFTTSGAYRTIYLYCFDRRYTVRAKRAISQPAGNPGAEASGTASSWLKPSESIKRGHRRAL